MASAPPECLFDERKTFFDPPPSYSEAVSSYTMNVAPGPYLHYPGFGLTAVDFHCNSSSGKFQSLINQANEWLQSNSILQVRKCETLFLQSNAGIPETQKMTYKGTTFVKGLRLWLTPRLYPHPKPQQIASFSVVPNILENKPDTIVFEEFSSVVQRVNSQLQRAPLNGHILTVESEIVKVTKRSINPEDLLFTEGGCTTTLLRVFYEIGKPAYETIACHEFYPRRIDGKTATGLPLYEKFPDLIQQISDWCSANNINICSIQTCPFNTFVGGELTSLRAIKVFTLHSAVPMAELWPSNCVSGPLMSKTFLPVQLTDGLRFQHWQEAPTFESMHQTISRINAWARDCKAKIVSAETCSIPISTSNMDLEGPQATLLTASNDKNPFHILIIRVYVDGIYNDPPEAMCPAAFLKWCQGKNNGSSTISVSQAKDACVIS